MVYQYPHHDGDAEARLSELIASRATPDQRSALLSCVPALVELMLEQADQPAGRLTAPVTMLVREACNRGEPMNPHVVERAVRVAIDAMRQLHCEREHRAEADQAFAVPPIMFG